MAELHNVFQFQLEKREGEKLETRLHNENSVRVWQF